MSSLFADEFSNTHHSQPYTVAFKASDDGQGLLSPGEGCMPYQRITLDQIAAVCSFTEDAVPRTWMALQVLMTNLERTLQRCPSEQSWVPLPSATVDEETVSLAAPPRLMMSSLVRNKFLSWLDAL